MKKDLTDPAIKCKADAIGARWFTLACGTRVFTFTEADAVEVARTAPEDEPTGDETPALL